MTDAPALDEADRFILSDNQRVALIRDFEVGEDKIGFDRGVHVDAPVFDGDTLRLDGGTIAVRPGVDTRAPTESDVASSDVTDERDQRQEREPSHGGIHRRHAGGRNGWGGGR
ncbi:hypothetical protein [Acuticoccus mangrovi]|uniref:Uncharacterized protein n=1 Tax=Acuticoccus mangrovi TaxID=2796142 RepID=A0A934ITP4_9HYPH|nr:hypothetical protein [Acuticoccus mangrovi]MBJ3777840.1 hypothetical protein [Acuticoccus mangrovi]